MKFHYSKYPININNIDIDKIRISDKVSLSKNFYYERCFQKYLDAQEILMKVNVCQFW